MRKNKKGKASFFLQAYLPSIESAMLIWITKALLTHQTGLWRFHFYWSGTHRGRCWHPALKIPTQCYL